MSKPVLPRWTLRTCAACWLLAVTGCAGLANLSPTTGVCYTSNTRIDPAIVYESDCRQTGGTWEERQK